MKRIVISITNNLKYDRRIIRIAKTFQDQSKEVLVIGRKSKAQNVDKTHLDKLLLSCWATKGVLFYLEFNLRLFFKLLFTRVDILYSVDSDTLLANNLISFIRQKPLIIDMHELFTEVPELQGKAFNKKVWNTIERWGVARSTLRYTVSQTIADLYEKQYGQAFQVVRNVPILTNELEVIPKSKIFTIVYLGALNMGRGIEILISALSKIDDVQLKLLGKGDLYEDLVRLSEVLNITDRVKFEGWVEPHDVHASLSSEHIGINILDSASKSYYLSLANKYFDYIHAGLPTISMDFPEYRVLNEKHQTSILIQDLDESQIIDAILLLKNNQKLYDQLAHNTIAAKAEWNWQLESKRLSSILDL